VTGAAAAARSRISFNLGDRRQLVLQGVSRAPGSRSWEKSSAGGSKKHQSQSKKQSTKMTLGNQTDGN